jgi:lipopolysaccharide export system permease protein
MRLDEIAHFATLGPHSTYLFWFILYQIPYILPIAVPIACLISTILLMQRLSRQQEITALRASGIRIRTLLAPLLCAASLLAIANFYIASEIATSSHLAIGLLKNQLRSVNPLLLMGNKHFMRLQGYYFDARGPSKNGEFASDILLALPDKKKQRISLLVAKRIEITPSTIHGHHLTLISSLHAEADPLQFDPLLVENIEETTTKLQDFFQLMHKQTWNSHNDHLQLSWLLLRLQEEQSKEKELHTHNTPLEELRLTQREIGSIYTEIVRRISLGVAAFTFTLMGAAFSITLLHRMRHRKDTYWIVALVTLYLACYFVAMGMSHRLLLATSIYLTPHLLIILCSLLKLRRATHGID